jgi:hypothetical protein
MDFRAPMFTLILALTMFHSAYPQGTVSSADLYARFDRYEFHLAVSSFQAVHFLDRT